LLCEEARLGLGVPALLVDPMLNPDGATTAVLSGRADLVAGAAP
jgi:anthraniloyl-CoA monooxygenase